MERQDPRQEELRTAKAETLVRLRSAGIELDESEDAEDLVVLLEAVERFEQAVRDRGGDLMVDQPPPGEDVEPDDPRYVLPQRAADETLATYTRRVLRAAHALK